MQSCHQPVVEAGDATELPIIGRSGKGCRRKSAAGGDWTLKEFKAGVSRYLRKRGMNGRLGGGLWQGLRQGAGSGEVGAGKEPEETGK